MATKTLIQAPALKENLTRYKETLPIFNHKTTGNMGDLIPFFEDSDIIPGSTWTFKTHIIGRILGALKKPIIDNLFLEWAFFFQPHRLSFKKFREFEGENTTAPWAQTTEYEIPFFNLGENMVNVGDTADYFGIPVGAKNLKFSQLPFRTYTEVWNYWYRDQNYMAPKTTYDDEADRTEFNETNGEKTLLKVSKYHDYITSGLPNAQKGEAVKLPLGVTAPIEMTEQGSASATDTINLIRSSVYNTTANQNIHVQPISTTGYGGRLEDAQDPNAFYKIDPNGTLLANLSMASAATVEALRYGIQLQGILNRMSRGGTRYDENIWATWGVEIPPLLYKPEYLGGNKVPISISELQQTVPTTDSPLGEQGAWSHFGGSNHDFTKSFSEKGTIIGVLYVRQTHTYQQGLERMWARRRKYDFYDPAFKNLGEQPILQKELCVTGAEETDNQVIGFQEAWHSGYHEKQNRITGRLRSGVAESLDVWHVGDYYATPPIINEEFLYETREYLDRTLILPSNITEQFLFDIAVERSVVRPMPLYHIPGLMDHF